MRAVTLQPAAGAQGELTGILMIRAYHRAAATPSATRSSSRTRSHGTNPATASMAGFRTITIPSAPDGGVDVDAFRAALGPRTAAVMITNPSTLGLFEPRIGELLDAVHEAGALAYMDGANLNAILGRFKPGEAGFDVMHFNVHKTFSHAARRRRPGRRPGRGGGARCCRTCPTPRVLRDGRRHVPPRAAGRAADLDRPAAQLRRQHRRPRARVRLHPGPRRVRACARSATTRSSRRTTSSHGWPDTYDLPYDRPCKHEFVASAAAIKKRTGVRTLDIAKRLIDYGFHPPTIYFPLIVEEGMLIEPTETESIETLDAFADALIAIAAEAEATPELVTGAPHAAPVRRLDEATAARQPNLRWRPMTGARDALPGLNPTLEHEPYERSLGWKLTVREALWIVPAAHRPEPCCRCVLAHRPHRVGGSIRTEDRHACDGHGLRAGSDQREIIG